MRTFLLISQITISALLILVILSQEKGLAAGGTFGGSGQFFHAKRGVDRLLFWLTVILAALFVATSIGFIFVPRDTSQISSPPSAAPTAESQPFKIEGLPEGVKVETLPIDPESSAQ